MKVLELNTNKIKSVEQLQKLNTNRLLRYYKSERKRFYRFVSSNTCDCCGERYWDLNKKQYGKQLKIYSSWLEYLHNIKFVLNKREHIKK